MKLSMCLHDQRKHNYMCVQSRKYAEVTWHVLARSLAVLTIVLENLADLVEVAKAIGQHLICISQGLQLTPPSI